MESKRIKLNITIFCAQWEHVLLAMFCVSVCVCVFSVVLPETKSSLLLLDPQEEISDKM